MKNLQNRNATMTAYTPDPLLPALSPSDRASLPLASEQFSWTPQEKIVAQRNMHLLFASDVVRPGTAARPLPQGRSLDDVTYQYAGGTLELSDYVSRTHAAGLLVLKDGKIVLERYDCGNSPQTIWASRSVAKSVTSTLTGIALHEGAIASLDDMVTAYVPELAGTLYEHVSLRQNLWMTSGQPHAIEFPSLLPLHECTVRGDEAGCLLRVLKKLAAPGPGIHPPGERFAYHGADVIVAGLVLERATGCRPARYLEQKIWQPFGMESAACWNLESPGGATFTNSGICATLRDWGRFGLFMLLEGLLPDGTRQLPPHWVAEATRPSPASIRTATPYGYYWWLQQGGGTAYAAHGNGGQRIVIHPAEGIVIAKWAVWNNPPALPSGPTAAGEDDALFAAIVSRLTP